MVDFIQTETRKIMYKCCEKYATSHGLKTEEVQLILGINVAKLERMTEVSVGQDLNTYKICEKYVPKKELNFLEVLGVKIDFLGYSNYAPQFIFKSLTRFATEKEIDFDKVNIMCMPSTNENGKPNILLYLYNGMDYLETITFEDLFRPEDFELPIG